MNIQTVFRAGNSDVVALPKHLTKETGIVTGEKVVVEKVNDGILIRKVEQKKVVKSNSSTEFNRWLKNVLEEDGEILDELSIR